MAKNKIDFKGAATKMAGHAAGAAGYTQLNKLAFMQKQTNPKIKGLITALIGYIGVPMVAEKLKLGGKGAKGEFIQHVGEGTGMVGVMQMANAFVPAKDGKPALFPTISGTDEEYESVGLIAEEDYETNSNVAGYEESPNGRRVNNMSDVVS